VGIGVIVGLGGSLVSARYLKTLLYGVTPSDVETYALVVAAIAASALLASWLPARSASKVDPAALFRGAAR
jgi:ABC-type lipoprotein release transport system permease subunit